MASRCLLISMGQVSAPGIPTFDLVTLSSEVQRAALDVDHDDKFARNDLQSCPLQRKMMSSRRFLTCVLLVLSPLVESASSRFVKRASHTSPPSGAVIVRGSSTQSGEFSTVQVCSFKLSHHINLLIGLQAAINSLPNDSSSRTIFIYPGTYTEAVLITRSGTLTVSSRIYEVFSLTPMRAPQIYGSTSDTTSYTANSVTIQHNNSAASAGSDAASSTFQANKSGFKLYNVNLKNTVGFFYVDISKLSLKYSSSVKALKRLPRIRRETNKDTTASRFTGSSVGFKMPNSQLSNGC